MRPESLPGPARDATAINTHGATTTAARSSRAASRSHGDVDAQPARHEAEPGHDAPPLAAAFLV
jgi:hypothetical protein